MTRRSGQIATRGAGHIRARAAGRAAARLADTGTHWHAAAMPVLSMDTQFGRVSLVETDGAITRLGWNLRADEDETLLLREAARQMAAYDAGELEEFDLPLHVKGSDFQRAVCDAMRAIPFGHTRTYGEIAKDLGHPAQAVGQACGANPIAIIIPCHRVMGAKGLTGFSAPGGVETKVALLRHEKAGGFLI